MANVLIDIKRCKGCDICVSVCPKKVLGRAARLSERGVYPSEAVNQDACIGCMMCVLMCPDIAITVVETAKPAKKSGKAA